MPKKVRDLLGIKRGSKVTFELKPNGDVVRRPVTAKPNRRSQFAKVRGSATVKTRTDEILSLTRAEV